MLKTEMHVRADYVQKFGAVAGWLCLYGIETFFPTTEVMDCFELLE